MHRGQQIQAKYARELIERGVILSRGPNFILPLQDIQPKVHAGATGVKPFPPFHEAERETILRALRESAGVIAGPSGAAARLGLRRTTLQSKVRRLGIRRPSY